MDGLRLPSYRKEFQKDDGLSRSLDSGSDPQWIEVGHPTGGGVVTWARTAAQTSNYGRTTPTQPGIRRLASRSPAEMQPPLDAPQHTQHAREDSPECTHR